MLADKCSCYSSVRYATSRAVLAPRTLAPRATAPDFEGKAWAVLSSQLDGLPVFTVADIEGRPLQYEVDGQSKAMFYADVDAAKMELEQARTKFPEMDGLDLIPVGVGSAYKLSYEDKAVVLPSTADLTAAGAPAGASAINQALPLFACMEMSQEGPQGPVLPLFMSWADCAAAVSQATQTDAPEEKLEIVGLSLASVVERLSSIDPTAAPAYIFVPPSASAKFISQYLDDSGGQQPRLS